MMHDREFWTRHVEGWRASGLTQRTYCSRHRLTKATLGYWASRLKRPKAAASELVEVVCAEVKEQRSSSPIELVVEVATCFGCGPAWSLRTCGRCCRLWSAVRDRLGGQRGEGIRTPGSHGHEEADQRSGTDRRAGDAIQRIRVGSVLVL